MGSAGPVCDGVSGAVGPRECSVFCPFSEPEDGEGASIPGTVLGSRKALPYSSEFSTFWIHKSPGQPGTCHALPPHSSWYWGAALVAKHLLTSADVCQDPSVCGQEPSPGFAPKDPSGVLCLISLLVLEQEDAVHIQGAGSEPDLEPRDRFLLRDHAAVAAAIRSGQARVQDLLPQERRGQRPWSDPHCPGGMSLALLGGSKPISALMLCACWLG